MNSTREYTVYNPYGFWDYYGAYEARMRQYKKEPVPPSEEQKAAYAKAAKEMFESVKPIKGDYDTFMVSEETVSYAYSQSTEGYNSEGFMDYTMFDRCGVDARIIESEDPFWKYTGSQYLVFSEELYKSGFYDSMSDEEVKESEFLLASITYAMDYISRFECDGCMMPWGISSDVYARGEAIEIMGEVDRMMKEANGGSYFPRSYEARMDLESSVSALHYFADTHIEDEDLKSRFRSLIDDYHAHNLEVLSEYTNLNEVWEGRQARWASKYGGGAYVSTELSIYYRVMSNVKHTKEETQSYADDLQHLFGQLDQTPSEQQNAVWEMIRTVMLNYATGGYDNPYIQKKLLASAASSFSIMENYWSQLLKVKEQKDTENRESTGGQL